jgi:Zn-dependent protease with chaperone function
MAVLLLGLPHQATPFHPLIRIMVMLGPLLVFYYCSRRFEYSADEEAVGFTGDRETATKALVSIYKASELPAVSAGLARIFMTHPTLAQRVRAIVSNGRLTADGLTDMKSR